jgi:hypothetical protein
MTQDDNQDHRLMADLMAAHTVDTGIHWSAVVGYMEDAPWAREGDTASRRVFIGTVFSLYPSGKYYMPWACSHVSDEEAALDAAYGEQLDDEAKAYGYCIAHGEGDPCDVFVVEYRDCAQTDLFEKEE